MSRILFSFLLSLFFSGLLFHEVNAESLKLEISSPAAILINADTGAILFEKNAKVPAFPASITKVATALYVLSLNPDLDELIPAKQEAIATINPQAKKQSNYRAPAYWIETDGTHMGIKKGEMISMRDLLYGLLLSSANDAANVIAQHLGGTIPDFMNHLNEYLKSLGCKQTFFCNPHGLHHPDHVSTPYDMAIIASFAMKNLLFKQIVSSVRYTCSETNLQGPRQLIQGNHMLRKGVYYYPKAIGVKTGYHSLAGKTLIAAAVDGNRTLIAVLFGCQTVADRYKDAAKIFEAAFNQPKMQKRLLQKGIQEITLGDKYASKPIKTYLKEDLIWDYYPAENESIKVSVKWDSIVLPLLKDQMVGYIKIIDSHQRILKELPLYCLEEVKPTLWGQIKQSPRMKWIILGLSALFIAALMLIRRPKRKQTRFISN